MLQCNPLCSDINRAADGSTKMGLQLKQLKPRYQIFKLSAEEMRLQNLF